MKETEATRHLMKNWQRQQPDLWFYKIPDARFGAATGDRAIDVVACYKGRFIGLEFKLIKHGLSIPIRSIRDSQLATLDKINKAGGEGMIIIIRYFGGRKRHAYLLYPMQWKMAVIGAKKRGKKSVKLDYFEGHRFDYKQVGRKMNWDMSVLEVLIQTKNIFEGKI